MIALIIFTQFTIADSLFIRKYYELAAVEYQREFFFHADLYQRSERRLRYAVALLNNDKEKGFEELAKIANDFPDLNTDSKITVAKCYIAEGYYYAATELLVNTEESRLLGYTLLLDERFLEAKEIFAKHHENALADEIEGFIRRPKKSIMKAAVLSFICPGSGEVYAGNVKQGIIDFILNIGTGYLMYDAVKDKRYVDAGLIFSFLFNRFYLGSLTNAQRFTQERNEQEKNRWLNHFKDRYFKNIND